MGACEGDELVFVKKLKNGFSALTRKQVLESLEGLEIDECPFAVVPDDIEGATWVRPVRTVEVEFVEWTSARRLRHAFFRRLMRPDEESSSKSRRGSTRRRASRR